MAWTASQLQEGSVAFEQFERYPFGRVGRRDVTVDLAGDLIHDQAVVGPDLGPARDDRTFPGEDLFDRLHQLAHSGCAGCRHGHDRYAQGGFQDFRRDADALLIGHVHHVQCHHQRNRQADQLRDQVQAALQVGGADDGHDQAGVFAQNELAGNDLLRRVGRQAVRAGQVHQAVRMAFVSEIPLPPFDGLAGPVANVLVQAGKQVKERGLTQVGLPGQGDEAGIHAASGWPARCPGGSGVTITHLPILRTMISWASPRPRATRVPRTVTSNGPRP